MKDKERQIIEHYGVIPQLKYMQTEMFEFIEAVFDYENLYKDNWTELPNEDDEEYKQHIEEEYADLTMMLEQIKVYYNLNEESIQKIREQKIERQLERIETSE